jgi:pyruvate kinase
MRSERAGVMIARGDLAVEAGFERTAELQEEILWACEAAHLPAIWATQVLESLAKTGQPSRAEITDVAASQRADCVMLNKGPYIVDAIRVLDDILARIGRVQHRDLTLMRHIHSWDSP